MKVNRPGSPLSSGAEPLEPLDPQELQNTIKSEKFAAALSQLEAQSANGAQAANSPTRSALEQIAQGANLSSSEGASTAVRESARYMIRSRLHEKFRQSEQATRLIEQLSDFVAADPLLNSKLVSILKRLKAG
jgi:hypothetical protein